MICLYINSDPMVE